MENWVGLPPQGSDLHGTQISLSSQAPLSRGFCILALRMQPRFWGVQGQPSLDICSGGRGLGFKNVLLRNAGLAGLTVCV